jgi:hypothetical protein
MTSANPSFMTRKMRNTEKMPFVMFSRVNICGTVLERAPEAPATASRRSP